MDGITVKISGTLKGPLDELKKEIPIAEKRALYRAAYFLRDKIRESLSTKLPKANVRSEKYSDTLIDAIGFSKVDGASLNVNAMGNRKKRSGTYRTRFFEEGTVNRYQKKRNGVRLKKKKFIGRIKPLKFFSSAVDANKNVAVKLMEDVITQYVDKAINK